MSELKRLEEKLITRLEEIRNKKSKTLNDTEEYKDIQNKLRQLHNIMIWIKEV